ncbi:MAG: glycosyltransferase family 4 protein [Oscillospiraceae bacterium]|nr:glycosyltransferase family 4 protein [Oscillospiraceae bacterium]
MKVLFLDAYFEPEQIAYTHMERDLLAGLVEAGFDVEILCPLPTRGISPETAREYKHRREELLFDGHVRVRRFRAPQEGTAVLLRALRYFWCNAQSFRLGRKVKNVDAVFAVSTPPTQGWIAGKVAKRLHVPFVYNLQDVFPDSLVNAGLTREGSPVWKLGRRIEDFTYRHAERIIVISEGFKRNLLAKGVPEDKLCVVSNWVDLDAVAPVARAENPLFDELGLSRSDFVVVYAGNLGEAQGAEVIVEAAQELAPIEDLRFVLFGGGSKFEEIKKKAAPLKNILVTGLLPQERVPEVYSLGDAALITCRPGTGGAGLPSKTWSIMACNTPIIASFDTDSDLADVLRESRAGWCVEPGDPHRLAEAILNARQSRDEQKADIRGYAMATASREACVESYVAELRNACRNGHKKS